MNKPAPCHTGLSGNALKMIKARAKAAGLPAEPLTPEGTGITPGERWSLEVAQHRGAYDPMHGQASTTGGVYRGGARRDRTDLARGRLSRVHVYCWLFPWFTRQKSTH